LIVKRDSLPERTDVAKRAPKRPADERKRLILEGAETVFADLGFAGADTTKLARAAGVSAPALYRYFPSKKSLFLQTLKRAGPRLAGIFARIIDESGDPLDAVWKFGLGYYDHVQNHTPVMKMWFQALSETEDPETRSVLQRNFTSLVDLLQANLDEGKRQGLVAEGVDTRVAAWHFMSIGLTFELIHMLGLDAELDRGKVEDWGRLYLKSIRRESGETADADGADRG
jgi:AcrR family transcriptional regulator